jgi:hypothetical protein
MSNCVPLRNLLIVLLFVGIKSKCAFSHWTGPMPYPYDGEPFPVNFTMDVCQEYNDNKSNVCCTVHNIKLTSDNFVQVDGAFATASGGCDICAINLKRFWCEYVCSPRQADFVSVSKEYYVYPDPEHPGMTITAQEVNLTVEATTACKLYESCSRVPFVTSVSAMGNTAGFLNFQGHNAIDNARQYINMFFTYDKTKGLYLGNDTGEEKTAALSTCNFTGPELHGYEVKEACSCNNC